MRYLSEGERYPTGEVRYLRTQVAAIYTGGRTSLVYDSFTWESSYTRLVFWTAFYEPRIRVFTFLIRTFWLVYEARKRLVYEPKLVYEDSQVNEARTSTSADFQGNKHINYM